MPRAFMGATGPVIRFYKEDRPFLENGGEIEIKMSDYPGRSVELHIVDEFDEETRKIKNPTSESWIRTGAVFDSEPPQELKIYRIWLEKTAASRLYTERESPMEDGCIETRGFGRICMTYWDI